ncbi:MAG TPA: hypothetical protein V6C81_19245 [Planktothrix sp.]|jgi:phage-related holin
MTSSVITTGPKESTEPYPWILHPVLDYLLCCGGLLLILALLVCAFPDAFRNDGSLSKSIVTFSLIALSMPHGLSSYLRVFNSKSTRTAIARKVVILGVVCVIASIATLFSETAWILVGHIVFYLGVQHLFAQSYGIALVYCYKRKYYWTKWEQKVFNLVAVQLVTFHAMARIFSQDNGYFITRSFGPAWFPIWVPKVSGALLYASLIVFIGVCVRKYIKEKKIMPMPAIFLLITTFVYQGMLPFLTSTPLLSAMAIAPNLHLTQYFAITTSYFIKEVGLPENVKFSQISSQLLKPTALKYFAFLLSVGFITTILIIPGVWNLGGMMGFDRGNVVLAVFICINAHHYITDSLIWKQRDPQVRKLLIS